jgi:hypothetical protein
LQWIADDLADPPGVSNSEPLHVIGELGGKPAHCCCHLAVHAAPVVRTRRLIFSQTRWVTSVPVLQVAF